MNLILKEDTGITNGRHVIIYDVEGWNNGIISAVELVMSLKEKFRGIREIEVKPASDHSVPRETMYYKTFEEFKQNEKDFTNEYIKDYIEYINIDGIDVDNLNEIIFSINPKNKTVVLGKKPLEKNINSS